MGESSDSLLNQHISDIECLNESPDHPAANLFANNAAVLKSDVDHQLLIKVVFRQPVKISGLRFTAVNADSAPTDIKVFMNQPNLAFNEAEDAVSTQDFSLTKDQQNLTVGGKGPVNGGEVVPLKFVKFQNVSSLQILVLENGGGEEVTELKTLEIIGSCGEKSDISEWKPVKG